MTGDGTAERLERRYRRLLACYPRAHRAEYGEEMLGVLLADRADDAGRAGRWPGLATTVDLLAGAGAAWLGRGRLRAGTGRWSGTAVVLGLVLPFSLALGSLPMYWIILRWNWPAAHHWQTFLDQDALMLSWAVVLALAFTRRRRATALAAWLCAVPQALYAAHLIAVDTVDDAFHAGGPACWPLVMVAAATALTAVALRGPGGDPRGAAVLAARRLGPVATGLLLCTAALFTLSVVPDGPIDLSLGTLFLLSGEAVGWGITAWLLTGAIAGGLTLVALAALAALARRAGLPVVLRLAGLALALGVLFAGGGRLRLLLLALGTGNTLVYELVRWLAVPLLAFALPTLAARLTERHRHHPTTPPEATHHG